MNPEEKSSSDVLLSIEKAAPDEYRIQSDQLEHIGEKLRGKRRFSVFNSIILPLIVSIATVVFTTLLQYISWSNTINLQNATDVTDNAEKSYEKASAAIRNRIHATFLFLPSLRDLILAKQKLNGAGGRGQNADPGTEEADISLHKFVLDRDERRFRSYYEHLRYWNENYDQLLTEVAYALDRPVLGHAGIAPIRVVASKMKNVKCKVSLFDALKDLNLRSNSELSTNSLKLQFAVIKKCFGSVSKRLDEKLGNAIEETAPTWDEELHSRFKEELGNISSKANEFRCYALRRIEYYERQKHRSILGPTSLWNWLTKSQEQAALDHFRQTAKQCNPENRPT